MGHPGAAGRYEDDPRVRDAALVAFAAKHHRVFTLADAAALGLSRAAVARRAARGFVHRVHDGVYAVGPPPLVGLGRYRAAVLACGPTALLSHRSGADLWRARPTSRARVDVTSARRRKGPEGVDLHRTRRLHPDDAVIRHGIPVTSWARTIVDLAEVLHPHRLPAVLHESEVQRVFDLRALEAALDRADGRRGARHVRAALAEFRPRNATRSELEVRLLALVARLGLVAPQVNVPVDAGGTSYEIDAFWPDQRLCVELDGEATHLTRRRFRSDRRRDVDLTVAGFRPLRFTWDDLGVDEARTAERLRRLLPRAYAASPWRRARSSPESRSICSP